MRLCEIATYKLSLGPRLPFPSFDAEDMIAYKRFSNRREPVLQGNTQNSFYRRNTPFNIESHYTLWLQYANNAVHFMITVYK